MSTLLSHSLAWALLYSLWQGLLVYSFLYVLFRALPDLNSRTKYFLSLGAFTALFAWFAETWITQYDKLKGALVYITSTGADGMAITHTVKTFAGAGPQGSLLHRIMPGIEGYFPYIMVPYTIGLALMLFRLGVNILQLRTLKTQATSYPDHRWISFIGQWRRQLNISRPVKLMLSTRVNVPVMLGTLKPVILLPVATVNYLTTEEVEAILLHELAHIRRHDYLINILQTIGETILFFNPFVWLISSLIRRERELCCDDIVVESAGSPLSYARALASIAGASEQTNQLALAATGNKNQLFHRIKRIMEMKKNNLNYSQLTIIIAAILAITFTVTLFTITPSFAQKAKKAEKADTTKKKVYRYKTVTIDEDGKETIDEQVSDKPIKNHAPGGANVSITYTDDDDTAGGKKIRKKIVLANASADVEYDEISKEVYDEVSKAMREAHKEMKEVDWDEIYKEMERSFAGLDTVLSDKEIKKRMEQTKETLEKMRKEMRNVKVVMVDARDKMDKANKEMKKERSIITKEINGGSGASYDYSDSNYETMLSEMEGDKLIDRSTVYVIRKTDEGLFINGKKQSAEVLEKYSHYLEHKTVDIKGKKGTLNININN